MGRENMIKYVCIFSAEISRLINYILLTSFYCRKVMAKDREKKDISIMHCPTGDTIGDYFTKSKQAKQFYKFRQLRLLLTRCLSTDPTKVEAFYAHLGLNL